MIPTNHREVDADAIEENSDCCGACRKFLNEDANGIGWCEQFMCTSECGFVCDDFEMPSMSPKCGVQD